MIWFTADFHFDHENIIKYCNRPYSNIRHMNADLIRKFNELVSETDEVFILGDLSMDDMVNVRRIEKRISQLNGNKHLILGNHDKLEPFKYIELGILSVHTALKYDEFTLVHDPAVCVAVSGSCLCGHVHNLFETTGCGRILNVGVDIWGYRPVSITQVRNYFEGRNK